MRQRAVGREEAVHGVYFEELAHRLPVRLEVDCRWHYVAQASFKFSTLWPQPPQYWDYRCARGISLCCLPLFLGAHPANFASSASEHPLCLSPWGQL